MIKSNLVDMNDDLIFVSYSRYDSKFALELADKMQKAGANVWMDQLNLETGTEWDNEIEKALDEANILIVVLSKAAVGSKHVKDEYSYALEQGMLVVPVIVEKCHVPFRLRRLHWADFRNDPKKGMHSLVRSLKLDREIAEKLEVTDYYDEAYERKKKRKDLPLVIIGSIIILAMAYWLVTSILPDPATKIDQISLTVHHENSSDSVVLPGKGLVKLMFSDTTLVRTIDGSGRTEFTELPKHVLLNNLGFKVEFVDPEGRQFDVRDADSIYYPNDTQDLNIAVASHLDLEETEVVDLAGKYGIDDDSSTDPGMVSTVLSTYYEDMLVLEDERRLPYYAKKLTQENIEEASDRYILAYGYYTLDKKKLTTKVLDSTYMHDSFIEIDFQMQTQDIVPKITELRLQQLIDSYWLNAEAYYRLDQFDKAADNYELLNKIYQKYPGTPEEQALLYNRIWYMYYRYGEFSRAEYFMKQRYELIYELYGPSHPRTAEVNGEYGILKRGMGEIEEAISYLEEDISIKEEFLDSLDSSLADSYRILAPYYSTLGDHEKAEMLLEKARYIFERSVPRDDGRWVNFFGNIVRVHKNKGDYTEALKFNDSALQYTKAIYTFPNTRYADAYRSRSNSLYKLEQYEEAIQQLSEAIEIDELLLGENHRRVAALRRQLGTYYFANGEFKHALTSFKRANEINRMHFESNDVRTGLVLAYLAKTYFELGNNAKLHYYGSRAKKISESATGNLAERETLSELVSEIDTLMDL